MQPLPLSTSPSNRSPLSRHSVALEPGWVLRWVVYSPGVPAVWSRRRSRTKPWQSPSEEPGSRQPVPQPGRGGWAESHAAPTGAIAAGQELSSAWLSHLQHPSPNQGGCSVPWPVLPGMNALLHGTAAPRARGQQEMWSHQPFCHPHLADSA